MRSEKCAALTILSLAVGTVISSRRSRRTERQNDRRTQPWWRRLLRLLALQAAVADGWGEPVVALRADLEAFARGGDQRLARTCRDLLRRAGAPTRRGRGRTPVPTQLRGIGVTDREMDVLALVADGLTNREIAERLFVSPRTIETHVANLLAKTGAASRAELRALAARPLTP